MPAILAATVTVEDQARLRTAAKPCHTQRIRHQLRAHVRLHRPAHHLTAEQVENDGQKQPTLVRPDVRDVRSPDLVGTRGREVSLQQVRCDRQAVVAVCRDLEPAFGLRLDAVQLHEPLDTILADANALGQQLLPHARPAVLAFGFGVHGLDVHQQSVVADVSARSVSIDIPRLARVVTAGADTQHLAGQGHRPLSAVKLDPGVLHADTFAKYAVAFSNMSRSIFTRANSARSRAISICSGETCLPAPFSFPAASAFTQLCRVFGLMPSIFATAAMLWPPRTMRTASSMNSCVYRALGLPIFPSSLREFYTLSKGSIFCGQAQGNVENTGGKDQRDCVVEEAGLLAPSASESIDSEEKRQDEAARHTRNEVQSHASSTFAGAGTHCGNHCRSEFLWIQVGTLNR